MNIRIPPTPPRLHAEVAPRLQTPGRGPLAGTHPAHKNPEPPGTAGQGATQGEPERTKENPGPGQGNWNPKAYAVGRGRQGSAAGVDRGRQAILKTSSERSSKDHRKIIARSSLDHCLHFVCKKHQFSSRFIAFWGPKRDQRSSLGHRQVIARSSLDHCLHFCAKNTSFPYVLLLFWGPKRDQRSSLDHCQIIACRIQEIPKISSKSDKSLKICANPKIIAISSKDHRISSKDHCNIIERSSGGRSSQYHRKIIEI